MRASPDCHEVVIYCSEFDRDGGFHPAGLVSNSEYKMARHNPEVSLVTKGETPDAALHKQAEILCLDFRQFNSNPEQVESWLNELREACRNQGQPVPCIVVFADNLDSEHQEQLVRAGSIVYDRGQEANHQLADTCALVAALQHKLSPVCDAMPNQSAHDTKSNLDEANNEGEFAGDELAVYDKYPSHIRPRDFKQLMERLGESDWWNTDY